MDRPIDTPIRVGAWRVDSISGQLSNGEKVVRIEARTMRLLLFLAERSGQVVSQDELLDQVWPGVIVTPDSVYQAITSLRRHLGDDPKLPTYIATVPRLGYRMVAQVAPWIDVPAAPSSRPPTINRRKWAIVLGVAAAIAIALTASYLVHQRPATGRVAAATHPSPPSKSVAVLPFVDLTTQEMNEEYFADGLTEELIGDLSKTPELRVPAPTSSFYFKGKQLPVSDIARQLGVSYVLDGSVRKSGNEFRVAARLIRADDGYVSWTESYDRPLGNLLDVQKDVAAEVTKAVRASIDGAAQAGGQPLQR
jgi:transcriptional activator of cad operon